MQDGGFQLVKSRRKKQVKHTHISRDKKISWRQGETSIDVNEGATLKKLLDAKAAFNGTSFLKDTKAILQRGLQGKSIDETICFGLGHFTECVIARHQLAFLLIIAELFQSSVFVHDPIFYDVEVRILQELGLNIIPDNEEGKRRLRKDAISLLYLPHCSKQLTNNFLWCNWGPELENCLLFGNSFSGILTAELGGNSSTRYIERILPYTQEFHLENNFKHQDIFNNTSIHFFPSDQLSTVEQGFWEDCEEPAYEFGDTEFITK